MKTRFRYGSVAGSFFNRHTVRDHILLPLLESSRFHVLFHSPMGVLFTFPSRYYFAIGHPGVFSLARWSLLIHTGFHVPHATRVRAVQYSTASPSSTTLVLLSHNPVFTV
ncbi:unnamed protein product [Spirodela intermedia]|uniref:Uncharacterized protein n=1 Tax=Spirodela intermedia TaxID=51605 RepID=A0A8S0Y7A6_SPIIN|nr:unnamed protein product [Spirodela intermedia]